MIQLPYEIWLRILCIRREIQIGSKLKEFSKQLENCNFYLAYERVPILFEWKRKYLEHRWKIFQTLYPKRNFGKLSDYFPVTEIVPNNQVLSVIDITDDETPLIFPGFHIQIHHISDFSVRTLLVQDNRTVDNVDFNRYYIVEDKKIFVVE